jgi:hypothetical protein
VVLPVCTPRTEDTCSEANGLTVRSVACRVSVCLCKWTVRPFRCMQSVCLCKWTVRPFRCIQSVCLSVCANGLSVRSIACRVSVCARMYRYNVQLSLSTPRRHVGGTEVQFFSFLTSILRGSEWSVSRSGRFTFGAHCKDGGLGPRASLEILEKRCLSLTKNQTPDRTVVPTTLTACNEAFPCSGLNAV